METSNSKASAGISTIVKLMALPSKASEVIENCTNLADIPQRITINNTRGSVKRRQQHKRNEHEHNMTEHEKSLACPLPQREHDEPPAPRRRINIIVGGLSTCRDSVRSIQAYCREAEAKRSWPSHSNMFKRSSEPITFTEEDARKASLNNDPLIVELVIRESSVTRILIDIGTSVNVIFKDVLIQMEIDRRNTTHETQPLTGFDGDTIMTVGTISLPIYVGGTMQCLNFAIVDKPIVYNIILGTPWLHKMRVVASTYHQCVKFPNAYDMVTLRGDPLMA
ncbi:PREDICTED: uncharacterized protein LOC104753518 [Camelina sativa]|uniref:Uncharacterized protein LOC104753518 n=1 Tax=Camelina sativa TaxID=90675 RepID=A0ABM0WP98_CAMSA|nr:PREDICTED: uncharacterized protein LOC104753518 [Camelina sativa]